MKHIFTNMPTQKLGLYLQAGGEMVGPIMTPSLYLTDIDADSTGTVMLSKCLGIHSTTGNWHKSIILPRYYFAPAITSTLLSCRKMVKIAAIRSIFAAKNSPKCFCWRGKHKQPCHSSPPLDAYGVLISIVFAV